MVDLDPFVGSVPTSGDSAPTAVKPQANISSERRTQAQLRVDGSTSCASRIVSLASLLNLIDCHSLI